MSYELLFLTSTLTKKNNIKIDKKEIKVQLLSHPHYPSLNCITDLFNHFQIENLALRVETNIETYEQLPTTFLVQIEDEGKSLLAIASKNKSEVELVYSEKTTKKIDIDKFLEQWTGIIIAIEEPEKARGTIADRGQKAKKIIFASTLLIFASLFVFAKPSIVQAIQFILSGLGVYISYLIVQQELGFHSVILDKFCSGKKQKSDCDAVLDSKGAYVMGLFKVSDAGLVYFLSLACTWLFIVINKLSFTSLMYGLYAAAVLLTFYSVYYQWKIIKNWCPLCLTIVGVLWMQFISLIFFEPLDITTIALNNSFYVFAASLLAVISFWIFAKPLLKKEQKFEKLEIEHIKFKRNFDLFYASLKLNALLNVNINSSKEIVFGNENPLLKIVLVTNPICGYCKESYQVLEKILRLENPDIQIIVRFSVRTEDLNAVGTKVALRLLEIYNQTNKETSLQALSEIYGSLSALDWLEKWGEALDTKYVKVLEIEKEWCTTNKINFTPAMLLNGLQYPRSGYEKSDIIFFIDDLIEKQQTKNDLLVLEKTV